MGQDSLLERVLEADNLRRALRQVRRNRGAPGIDGMTVEELPEHLKEHWPRQKESLLNGTYKPQSVRSITIPKPGGGERQLGVPTVLDRFIQQALMQVLQEEWDDGFSPSSYGFCPNRSAHHAVVTAQEHIRQGYSFVVVMDLEKFFDRVNHDVLTAKVVVRIRDQRIVKLIRRILTAGVVTLAGFEPVTEGTPQGSLLSPILSNLLLDEFDKELERRGHRFVRYADDCNIYVRSKMTDERVMPNVTRYLEKRLRLTFTCRRDNRFKISDKALRSFKVKTREITRRTRGCTLTRTIDELRAYILGWKAYFGLAEVLSPLKDLDKWVRRRLRSYVWKQWGHAGYRELRKRGVGRELAWNTCKSAHGPWRLSQSPALVIAMPGRATSAPSGCRAWQVE
ncbi:MAG: group II intron reverse transcriptase/maturase [Desulfobacterales bacterium]